MDGLFRNKKVRGLCCLVLLLALVLSLAGCGNGNEAQNTAAEAETVTAQDVGANGDMQSGSSLLLDGIHKTVIEQDRWKDMLRGLGMTVTLLVLSVCIALFLGSGIFMLDYFGGRFWQSVFKYFSVLFLRMPFATWMIIVLFVIFRADGSKGFWASIVALSVSFAFGIFGRIQSGVMSVNVGQKEAAVSMGYGKYDALMKIYLPQALPDILGALQGDTIGYVATTSVAGILSVTDLQTVATVISTETMKPLFPLLVAAVLYILLGELVFRGVGVLKDRICPPEPSEEAIKEKLMKGRTR